MIDTKELRASIKDIGVMAFSTQELSELLDRLEAAEKERDKLKELNSALCTKSNSQVIHNARLAEENDALRAKIAEMEKQEPGAYMPGTTKLMLERGGSGVVWNCHSRCVADEPLYALPGAQPAPSLASGDVSLISEGKTQPALSMPNLHVGNLPTANQDAYPALGAWWVQLWDGDDVFARVYGATPEEAHSRAVMLAAAPEAKR